MVRCEHSTQNRKKGTTMIKAVIFDFDGTLADTLESIKHGINITMDKFGYPHSTRDDVQAHINHGARNLIKLSLPLELQSDDAKIDEAYAVYNEMYKGVYLEVEELYAWTLCVIVLSLIMEYIVRRIFRKWTREGVKHV